LVVPASETVALRSQARREIVIVLVLVVVLESWAMFDDEDEDEKVPSRALK